MISSRHPQANGQVERPNQIIIPAMQATLNHTEGRDWGLNLPKLERDVNHVMMRHV